MSKKEQTQEQTTEDTTEDTPGSGMISDTPDDAEHENVERDQSDDTAHESEAVGYMFGEVDIPNIDEALASVASLSDVIAEREAAEARELAQEEAKARASQQAQERRSAYYMNRPPLLNLKRGQLASVVPALVLMGVGAWLTFALATDATLTLGLLVAVGAAALGVVTLVYWLTTERWSQGALFTGLTALLCGGVLFWLAQENTLGADGWPLLVSAVGAAALLTGVLSAARRYAFLLVGLALIVVGTVGLFITTTTLDETVTDAIEAVGWVVLLVVAVLVVAPAFIRQRG